MRFPRCVRGRRCGSGWSLRTGERSYRRRGRWPGGRGWHPQAGGECRGGGGGGGGGGGRGGGGAGGGGGVAGECTVGVGRGRGGRPRRRRTGALRWSAAAGTRGKRTDPEAAPDRSGRRRRDAAQRAHAADRARRDSGGLARRDGGE